MELGLIDPDAPLRRQAQALHEACSTTGFFRIPAGIVERQIVADAWETGKQFFALPEADKRRIEFPEPGYPYGYSPFKFETLAKSHDANRQDITDGSVQDGGRDLSGPDLKESLSDPRGEEAWIRSPSLWPDEPSGLRPAWTAYYQALAEVAERLMAAMAVALDLPASHFEPMIDRPITSMRALHYPELEAAARSGSSLRAGAHSDYGTLTILRTDAVEGLEIQAPDGQWVGVEPLPDTFVVNLGDSIAQWTNDRWRSTVHRVALTDTAPRQSFAFFHMANWDATIECLPTCQVKGEPPRHAPVQAGPWLMKKFQATVT